VFKLISVLDNLILPVFLNSFKLSDCLGNITKDLPSLSKYLGILGDLTKI
jgi:hypothetical protein